MARIVMIGYGNRLRSDDGVGCAVAEKLASRLSSPQVEVIVCHQLTPELADTIRDAEIVFFIDAARQGVPGTFSCNRVSTGSRANSSHSGSPSGLLALAGRLYNAQPQALSVTLPGTCFDHGEDLSPELKDAVPRVAAYIEMLAAAILESREINLLDGQPTSSRAAEVSSAPSGC